MEPEKKTRKLPHLTVVAGLMILIPLIAAGCIGNSPVLADIPLNGTGWTLTGYVTNGTSLQTLNNTMVTMVFSNEGRITGSAGCNHYFATYEIKGTTITIGQAGSTEMYCSAAGVMEQEGTYLTLLGKASLVTAGNDTLTFADSNGSPILSFARIVPSAPEPLAGTTWTLDSIYTVDAVSSVTAGTIITAVFDENGRLTGSAGCNHYFASYNVTGISMSIGPAGSTKMYCNGPDVMLQETTYLASLSRAAAFTIIGDRLSLADANGATLLSFTKES
ncbi:MAG: META domain-containing protein [Methanoregulaceae archaeon]|jgi:heat shock protein HslJ|nr:MAG: META domain-containing protein [Methanoregulaceae archaeon]